MLTGKLIVIDEAAQKGKIEQDLNQRVYDFDFSVWDADSWGDGCGRGGGV